MNGGKVKTQRARPVRCGICARGSGECCVCKGTGSMKLGQRCNACDGSGICNTCRGSGYLDEDDDERTPVESR